MNLRWITPLLLVPAACAGLVEIGPSYADAWALARPHCSETLAALPAPIDRNVHAIRLSGHNEAEVVAYLFSVPSFTFVERELNMPLADGTRLIGYAKAGASQ